MIQFPKDTHSLHLFHQDDQRYVVDLDVGEVVTVDEVMWDILALCPTCTFIQMLEQLKDKYPEESIFESIRRLEQFAQLGLLLSEEPQPKSLSINEDRRLKIFVMHDELYPHLPPLDVLSSMNNQNILLALAKEADVYIGIPEESADQIEFAEGSGFYKVPIKSGRTYSPIRYLHAGYDGILALSRGYFEDLPFFCGTHTPPVVVRVYSSSSNREHFINSTLAKIALLRDFDAIVADAPWLYPFFARCVPSLNPFHVVADGLNLKHFAPMEKQKAKKAMSEILQGTNIIKQPVVGWFLGSQLELNLRSLQELAASNQDIIFLIYTPASEEYTLPVSDNLYYFGRSQHWDMMAIPLAFNAMDALFFLASVGSPASFLTGAMACGVPTVVASYAPLSGLNEAQFVQLKPPRTYNDHIPYSLVIEKLKGILHDKSELARLGESSRRQAEEYTWERAAKELVSLFKRLNQKQMIFRHCSPRSFPISFCRYYNKRHNIMQSQAFQRTNLDKMSVEYGIALDLLGEHTQLEVEGVLTRLCDNPEEASSILNDASGVN